MLIIGETGFLYKSKTVLRWKVCKNKREEMGRQVTDYEAKFIKYLSNKGLLFRDIRFSHFNNKYKSFKWGKVILGKLFQMIFFLSGWIFGWGDQSKLSLLSSNDNADILKETHS